MGANFINKYQNWLFQTAEKSHYKIVKFEIKNFEHLHCKV